MPNRMALVPVEASEEMRKTGAFTAWWPTGDDTYAAMLAAAPGSGKVTRGELREALNAAQEAFNAMADRGALPEHWNAAQAAEEDALAAALGLEVEG